MTSAIRAETSSRALASPPRALPRLQDFDPNPPHAAIFWALMLFFFLEFLRPPVLSQLKFQMLFVILIPILWATSRDRPWSSILTLQLLMLLQAAVSVSFAVNYFTAFTGTRTMWPNVVASLAIFWVLSREKYFTKGIWVWALIMGYQAFYAATIGGGHGSGGILGDENDLAMAAGMAVPFMLMSMQLLRGLARWLALGLLVVLIMGIVVSESRGGFLGLAAAIGYCLFYSANRGRNFAIILVGGLVFFMAVPKGYKEEMSSISQTSSGTAEARFFLWTAATKMWLDNPVLGVGSMNSPWLIGEYQPEAGSEEGLFADAGYRERDWTMTPTHSIYFEMLAETGILGTGLFFGIVWLHFAAISRTRKRARSSKVADEKLKRDAELYGVALAGAMIGFLVSGAFLSVLYYPFFYYFAALAAAFEVMMTRRLDFANALASARQAARGAGSAAGGEPSRRETRPSTSGPGSARPDPESPNSGASLSGLLS